MTQIYQNSIKCMYKTANSKTKHIQMCYKMSQIYQKSIRMNALINKIGYAAKKWQYFSKPNKRAVLLKMDKFY